VSSPVLLDAGPLGRLAHPRPNVEILHWLRDLLASGVRVIVPEIADYEVRRSLLLADLTKSVARLDELGTRLEYQVLTTTTMRMAAGLWADAGRQGIPTADPKEFDCDCLLAAQALEVGGVVATENVGHLARYVAARYWRDIG
jgi:predicted nucleic acid-binding protein